MSILKKLFTTPDHKKSIPYQGLHLPLIRSNEGLADNETYLRSGLEQIETLVRYNLFDAHTKILDFGCGQGRLANSLLYANTEFETYTGIDTQKAPIAWCKRFIQNQNFEFYCLTAYNERYNPKAKSLRSLPFIANHFDLVFLNSVFSHMLTADIKYYLKEFFRVVKPGKAIYATAFVEENVASETENPSGYFGGGHQPLTRVRYEKSYFLNLFTEIGWEVLHFGHQEIKRTGQSVIIVKKPNI